MASETPVLEMRGITKRFPGIVANDAVDFDLRPGEVHALLGENGAGKSTLMNILYGLYTPDEGEIRVRGKKVVMHSPRDAIAQGIGMVHQHFMLIPVMTVAENVVLADEPRQGGVLLDYAEAERRVRELAARFKFGIDPGARIENISVAQQQRVEILKALYRKADILILDEPTAVLTPQEANELFEILRGLIAEGLSVIFITHKLDEVLRSRTGSRRSVAASMVETIAAGGCDRGRPRPDDGRTGGPAAASTRSRRRRASRCSSSRTSASSDDRGLPAVRDVSFEVRAGEIVGIAGVDGNGQSELIDALTGLRKPESGRVVVGDDDVTSASVRKHLDDGIGHIPEDRQRRGLVLEFSLAENLAFFAYRQPPVSRLGVLSPRRMVARARDLLGAYDVRGGGPQTRASALSGGNQQKVVLAREVERDPQVLIAAQPTRGLDVGAIEFVHRRLIEERDVGRAILLVSFELEEVLSLSDRILVVYEGRIVGEFPPTATQEELGLAMVGGTREAAA